MIALMDLTAWHWLIIAVGVLVLELLTGTIYLLWISFAAAITALLLWVFGFGWEMQILVFTVVSILSVFAWYKYDQTRDKTATRPNLNKRGHQYIGRTFQLSHPIENGVGKINVDDSTWKVRGADAPLDTKVRVTDIDGTVLIVEIIGA